MPTALLVEDDDINRKLMRDILEIKFHVLLAGSAEEARSILQDQIPDIVILDVQLVGMDGLTFLRELKQSPRTATLPVVIVSAHVRGEDVAHGLASGCSMYVTKPIIDDPFWLVERIGSLLTPAEPEMVQR